MVWMGDEPHLSASINFESIGKDCLDLEKADAAGSGSDCVRVSPVTAVEFVADLQRREEVAFPDLRDRSAIDGYLCPAGARGGSPDHIFSADTWADQLMQEAEANGYDNVHNTWLSVRRVQATKRAESFHELKPYHFDFMSKW